MVWEVLGFAALALFLAFWLLVIFVFARLVIPAEPVGPGKVGMVLVVVAANLALITVFLGPVYDLASTSGIFAPSPAVGITVAELRTVLGVAALLIILPGGWMRVRALWRESHVRHR